MSKRPLGSSRTHTAPSRRGYAQPVAEPSGEEYSGDIVGGPNSSDVAADDPDSLTIPTSHLIGFILASLAIIIVPGPSALHSREGHRLGKSGRCPHGGWQRPWNVVAVGVGSSWPWSASEPVQAFHDRGRKWPAVSTFSDWALPRCDIVARTRRR